MDDWIRVSEAPGLCRIELNRPAQRNALHSSMMWRIAREAREADDRGEQAIVLSAVAGAQGFCAGADLKEIRRGEAELKAQEEALVEMILTLAALRAPLIVVAQGMVLGGGVMPLALADIVIASEDLRVALPEIDFGVYPAVVQAVLMRKLSLAQAASLCMTGREVDGAEALGAGLVSELLPVAGFAEAADDRVGYFAARRAPLEIGKRARRVCADEVGFRDRFAWLMEIQDLNYRRDGTLEAMGAVLS